MDTAGHAGNPSGTGGSPVPRYYTALAPFATLFRLGLPILTYHVVGPRPWRVRLKGLYVSPGLFDRQLAELRRADFTLPAYDRASETALPTEPVALISMDDATRKTGEYATPILARHGARAIQFVVADLIGRTNAWQTAQGEAEEPLMDGAQLQDWLDAGHSLGSHTLTHPWLTRIPLDRAREEISASKKTLEDRFGRRIEHFCYPYGDHNPAILDLVAEAGYRTACTTQPGINTPETPRLALRRVTARYRSRSLKEALRWLRVLTAACASPAAGDTNDLRSRGAVAPRKR
jgi:peptidoglycan/xylan/chitin deacetylase (PgdA/CDA1 family)